MKNKLAQLVSCACIIFLTACGGGSQVIVSQAEIDAAKANNNLQQIYDKVSKVIIESKGSSKTEAIALREKIAGLLVKEKSSAVESLLNQHEQKTGSVSRKQLIELKNSIAEMQQWSATDYARILPSIERAISEVNQNIAQLKAQTTESSSITERVLTLGKIAGLAGEGEPEYKDYETERENTVAQLKQQGSSALNKRDYRVAVEAAEDGLVLDPGNVQFESMLSQAQAGLFEEEFRFAIENGKPESAYQAVLEVADKPIFLQLKKSMRKSILLLANFFASNAEKSYKSNKMFEAYQNFAKGRNIQQLMDVYQPGFMQEKAYLDRLMKLTKQADLDDGHKLAYLSVINEFDKNYPGLQTQLNQLRESVQQRAMTKISFADFKEVASSDSVVNSIGRRVGSKLEKILFEKLGNELSIVTQNNLVQKNNFHGLALMVDGEVLQAAIESTENKGKRTQRAQVSVTRVETEEYQDWAKRKRGEAPKQYHETPIMEEVELTVKHVRKLAVAEIAFRVIEPATGTILLTDTIASESQFTGESIDEFQKGDFHQPYVSSGLPSDIKIMDTLSSEVAEKLGEKLATYLQSPEQVFYMKAMDAKARGDNAASIELLANALSIAEAKQQDVSSWFDELKTMLLSQN